MNSGAPLRRSTRAAARQALAKLCAAAAQPPCEPPAAAEVAEGKQRKRQKTAKSCMQAATSAGTAAVAAATLQPGKPSAVEENQDVGKPRRAPKKKAAATAVPGPSREHEEELWKQGFANVAGVDEAGRGPLAGPVVAAACIIPPHVCVPGIDDSKKLNEGQREEVYQQLTTHPDIRWATQVIEAGEIDQINILQATLRAMEGAAAGLGEGAADFILVDGNRLPKAFDPQLSRTIVKGDSKCYAIAAASIIAKVTRDRLMDAHHHNYPHYNFASHKGYGVPAHVEAIRKHGPCPIHRRSFAPVKHWYPAEGASSGK